ncbi:hypothetical protein ACQUY5_31205 [Bacillus cereus]|uniref:hypothetical protein n=1 Tax=Bacillus cereus TaxID=1396 RepID=UPI003D16D053
MKTALELASMEFMVAMIVEDLENFRIDGSRLFDLEEVSNCTQLNELQGKWLSQFEDLSSIGNEIVEEIKIMLSEHMGYMSIWNIDEAERNANISVFKAYFKGYDGFCKLVVDLYETSSKEDEEYKKVKNSPEFKAKYKEVTGRDI